MPSLGRTLQEYDLGHLRVIAELWGIEMPRGRAPEAAAALARRMLDSGEADEIVEALPQGARQALDFLASQGRAPLTELQLRFGPLRRTGPGRRDREQPWRDREAALDGLWYRGLIGLAFFDTPTGPREFAFIPDDLLPVVGRPDRTTSGLPHSPAPARVLAGGGAAEDAVTVLAALRRRPSRSVVLPPARAAALRRHLIHPASLEMLAVLLREMGVASFPPLRPDPDATRQLLRSERSRIESDLAQAWSRSKGYNDLASVPGLVAAKGRWPNDPVLGRLALDRLLSDLVPGAWYELEAFVAHVRQTQPTFLRPAGDFDSWYMQDRGSGRFLGGFENWEAVDGAYVRCVVTGALHWLGAVDLGRDEIDEAVTRFRLRARDEGPSAERPAAALEAPPARVSPDGRVFFPIGASLPHRYQVARFCEWVRLDSAGFLYRLTPRALAAAQSQGLEGRRVAALLQSAARRPLPENLVQAIERASKSGLEVAIETTLVLRTKDPATLRQLQAEPATARYLDEILGPRSARIRARDLEALLAAAARRGLLVQPPTAD